MTRGLAIAAAVALLGACRGGGTKTKRTGSAAPVVVIDEPQRGDAGQGQFLIAREDLRKRDFSKVWYQWDCS